MSVAERARPNKQHIRRIRFHFLSRNAGTDPDRPTRTARLEIRVTGDPGSPWPLPLAVNLALCAAASGEAGLLVVPPAQLSAAARLLGAAATQLGPCFDEAASVRALEPCAGLTLSPPFLQPLLTRSQAPRWIISALPQRGAGRGPWLYLADDPDAPFADPRAGRSADASEPLFLLGLGHQPAARTGITGVWGAIAVANLLDPGRPAWPRYLTAPVELRRRFEGFLAALRQWMGAHSPERPGR